MGCEGGASLLTSFTSYSYCGIWMTFLDETGMGGGVFKFFLTGGGYIAVVDGL